MSTLLEIEAAADALPPDQKAELVRFLSARLDSKGKLERAARLVEGPNGTLLLEAPPGAPPMTTEAVKHMLEEFPVSGWLLDVNVLLGCGWKSHADNQALLGWLVNVGDWATCPLTESGFIRISITTAYQATFDDARKSLATLRSLSGHRFLLDDVNAALLPVLSSYKDTTDAHLVTLAKRNELKLATLDASLIAKSWAAGVAENPLLQSPSP